MNDGDQFGHVGDHVQVVEHERRRVRRRGVEGDDEFLGDQLAKANSTPSSGREAPPDLPVCTGRSPRANWSRTPPAPGRGRRGCTMTVVVSVEPSRRRESSCRNPPGRARRYAPGSRSIELFDQPRTCDVLARRYHRHSQLDGGVSTTRDVCGSDEQLSWCFLNLRLPGIPDLTVTVAARPVRAMEPLPSLILCRVVAHHPAGSHRAAGGDKRSSCDQADRIRDFCSANSSSVRCLGPAVPRAVSVGRTGRGGPARGTAPAVPAGVRGSGGRRRGRRLCVLRRRILRRRAYWGGA